MLARLQVLLLLMPELVAFGSAQEYDYQDGDCGLSAESMYTLERAWLDDNWDLSDPANEITVMCAAGDVGAVAGTVIGGGLGAALGWFASAAIGAALDMDDSAIGELQFAMTGMGAAAGGGAGNVGGRSLGKYIATQTIEKHPKVVLKKKCFNLMEITYSIDEMTEGQLKQRFRRLARVMHPDTNTGSDEQMKELVVCHEIARLHKGFFDPRQGFREKEL